LYHIKCKNLLKLMAIRLSCIQKMHLICTQNKKATPEDAISHGQETTKNNKQKAVLVILLVFRLTFSTVCIKIYYSTFWEAGSVHKFQNKCCYIIIIYNVIKHKLESNY
jgi:hypothetical protein